ncbi:hypothetical protein ACSBR1_039591 [Camellia fascicularis]
MPDDILSFILSFLSIRDSVKARIVSRRWRHICPFMLNLDFDLHTVLGINYKARYSKSKFVTGVDQFLELYNGQKLDSLKICFYLGNECAGNVDRWIRFAIIMKTEKFDLDFPCQLRPQEHVPLNQSCANSILSSCLNFEWLRLKNSILPKTLCIHGPSLQLKILIVHECYGVEKIEISSIGLTTFEYMGKVKNFCFLDVPRLEKVLPIPARITRFNSLKQLELFVMVSSDFNLLSLTSLLNASPLLQKLHLSLHTGRSRGRRIERQFSKHVHCELKDTVSWGDRMRWSCYLFA